MLEVLTLEHLLDKDGLQLQQKIVMVVHRHLLLKLTTNIYALW